ncbi:MAG: nicotinate-nucleotide--dimethylbenzimidazole phosphoribosyltransferase [Candidatus Metalachnospira sp.]|nr:nicotinate-nucleotide--dimethylbenzimidazole phosphoribosyltransferase [Candidatus Metalachnospira sp.]
MMVEETKLFEVLNKIKNIDIAAMDNAKIRWDNIGKPIDGLGRFEKIFIKIAGIKSTADFTLRKKAIAVMCSDNGVVDEGVSQSGSGVTAIVAGNIAKGRSSVCLLSKSSNTEVFPFDVGMKIDVEGVTILKTACGSGNICKEEAMSRNDTVKTILNGIRIAEKFSDYDIVGIGEMGIGNTTTSSAVCAVLTGLSPEEVTGYGAGLSDDGYIKKLSAIKRAIEFHKPNTNDVIEVLSKVGGYDIAALTGFIIGCAFNRIPVVLDGVITQTSALAAVLLKKEIGCYIFASHCGREPACKMLAEQLSLEAVINADMALGEGTGAALFMSLIDCVSVMYETNVTFNDIKVEKYEHFRRGQV